MQEAVGSASKFFKQIFTKKTKLKDEFKMGFGISPILDINEEQKEKITKQIEVKVRVLKEVYSRKIQFSSYQISNGCSIL